MATARLVPSAYTLSNSSYFSVSNISNAYTNTDSTNYATFQTTNNSTSSRYVYLKGFNFSSVPSGSIISSIAIKVRGYESGANTGASYAPCLCNGTSALSNTTASENFGTSTKTITVPIGALTWDSITNYGSNFGIRLDARRSSRNTASYLYIYGAEIEVTYGAAVYHDITVTNSTSATVSPTGTTSVLEGDSFTVLTDTLTGITVKDNNVDVTNQFTQVPDGSLSQTAASYTTELSASGANFYTSSSSTGNYFNYAVGHTAESPGSTSTSYNTYVKDNSNNTATGWAWYTFDFSDIPSGAEIQSVSVKVYGACESTTHDSTHKANITLYSGSTQKGSEQYFTSTSNSIITLSNVGTWTRSELQNAKLKFEVAYYGGRCFGITWTVTYSSDGYVYTISNVAADHTIIFSSGGGNQPTLYVKQNGTWKQVQHAYKKVNGSWQQISVDQAFQSGTNYVKGTL